MATYNLIYDKNVELQTLKAALENAGATIIKEHPSLGVFTITSDSETFATVAGVISWGADESLQATPSAWHQNRVYSPSLPMVEKVFPKNVGAGATVYLIDSGVDTTHPEFESCNIVPLYSFDGTFTDERGHGTEIAGLIVGKTLGIVNGATLKVVKIPLMQQMSISDLLSAFDAILADHLLTPSVKVINCSWTIVKNQILDTKISELETAGLVVVAAAGNGGIAADDFSPVGLNSVLGVGASDAYDRVISWAPGASTNWGPEVDITAPGITVDVVGPNGTYTTASGTSLSAGIVSGIVAQYIVEFSDKTSSEIQDKIIELASKDLLFRNETIYGTTPNVLVRALGIGSVFDTTQDMSIVVQRGASAQHLLQYREDIVARINTQGVIQVGTQRVNAEWMTYDAATKLITVSPPADYAPGIYRMYVEAFDANGFRMSVVTFSINVYNVSPDENTGDNIQEYYLSPSTDGTVIVLAANCHTGFCWSDGTCSGVPPKGAYCYCFSNQCTTHNAS